MRWILILVAGIFFVNGHASVTTASDGVLTTFPIDPGIRGSAILSMYTALLPSTSSNSQSQIALQTLTSYGNNGLIINIQNITLSTNQTLLIVSYYGVSGSTVLKYVVIPVEQVVSMIYTLKPLTSSTFFGAEAHTGVLPIIAVDPAKRAADIVQVFNTLNTISPYATSQSQVALQTTLKGTYTFAATGMAPITNGLILDIQSISTVPLSGGTLLLISYQVGVLTGTVIVAPEQIYAIIYSTTPFVSG